MLSRRDFLKGVTSFTAGLTIIPGKPLPQWVRELEVGQRFRYGRRPYMKLDDGPYTRDGDQRLNGDAVVLDLERSEESWMGPDCPVNREQQPC
jgi:hypothetical protein